MFYEYVEIIRDCDSRLLDVKKSLESINAIDNALFGFYSRNGKNYVYRMYK